MRHRPGTDQVIRREDAHRRCPLTPLRACELERWPGSQEECGFPNSDSCADLFRPECRLSSVLPQNVVWLQNESPALTSELLMSCACWERLTHQRGTVSIRVFLALIVPAVGSQNRSAPEPLDFPLPAFDQSTTLQIGESQPVPVQPFAQVSILLL